MLKENGKNHSEKMLLGKEKKLGLKFNPRLALIGLEQLDGRPVFYPGELLPIITYAEEAPPERGTFFSLQTHRKVGNTGVELYERVK